MLTRQIVAGVECRLPILKMELQSPLGWLPIQFNIDTGTSISIIHETEAAQARLSTPSTGRRIRIRVVGGTRSGRLTTMNVRFPEHPQRVFAWPALIAESPTAADARRELPSLLGLAGFLTEDFDMLIDAEHFTLFDRHSWLNRRRVVKLALASFVAGLGVASGIGLIARRS